MSPLISVIICTHNPRQSYLAKVLAALRSQSLSTQHWELLLIDNKSDRLLETEVSLAWHPHARHIREDKIGLTAARLCGIENANAPLLVFVDDDNVLQPDYLRHTIDIFQADADLGAIGGKSLPEFETEPESWIRSVWGCLALRDFGEAALTYRFGVDPKQHPDFAPIGAGMAIRRAAAEQYRDCILHDPKRKSFDRTGKSLQSGGDCDINLTILNAGWAVGYFPQLELLHLIPANRIDRDYLARLNRASCRSWVQVLDVHDIRPWQRISAPSVLPRKLKAVFSYKPWKSPVHYIRWQGACGLFEGLSTLPN